MPKSILIIGNYGAGNLGDDAILGGILEDLKAIGYKGEIEIMHGGHGSSPEIYSELKKNPFYPTGLRSKLRGSKESKEAIKRADLVILGGGGLFVDAESIKAPIIWAAQAKACQKLGTPYICYGQSVGPLNRQISRKLTEATFKGAKAVHVRDQRSAYYLKTEFGIEGICVGTDPAFSWLEKQENKFKKTDNLIVVLREWTHDVQSLWTPILAQINKYAEEKNLKTTLMAMDPGNAKEIKALKATGIPVLVPNSAAQVYKHIAEAEAAITMRLHSAIFAIGIGTPLLALSYSIKVKNLMGSLGAGDAEVRLNHLNQKSLNKIRKVDLPPELIKRNQDFLSQELQQLS